MDFVIFPVLVAGYYEANGVTLMCLIRERTAQTTNDPTCL
jgi:hypothetical protein